MAETSPRKQRGKGRPWRKGQSGNPQGRTPGSGMSGRLRQAIAEDMNEIVITLVSLAKSGDVRAAGMLLDKVLPDLRAESAPVMVPMFDSGTLTQRAQAVLAAVAAGEIAPDTGASLVSAVGALGRIIEVEDIERRLTELERRNGAHDQA